MNNDTPFTTIGDEPVEARIVAWVLGEASAFEAAELERLCEERPELMVFKRRMLALHGLLAEAETAQPDAGWRLRDEKRKALDELLGEEKPVRLEVEKEKRIRRSGLRAFQAIAACLLLTAIIASLIGRGGVEKARKSFSTGAGPQSPDAAASRDREKRLEALNKAVRDQEDKVEERRKVLATIARTKGIIYKGQDSFYGDAQAANDQPRDEAIKRGLDAQDYVDAKREFESDQEMLQKLKLRLIDEEISNRVEGQGLAQNSPAPQYFGTEVRKSKSAPATPASPPAPAAEVASADTMDQLARNDADPFAEASPELSSLSARKPAWQGAGYGLGSGGGGASKDAGRIAGEKSQLAERSMEGDGGAPAAVAQPARSRNAKGDASQDELLADLDKVLDSAASAEEMPKAAKPADQAPAGDVSGSAASGKYVGGVEITGGAKFKLQPGSTSEYHFRGADLGNPETANLAKAIRQQEEKVEERRKVLATIVRTKGIVYKGGDSFYNQDGVDEHQDAHSAQDSYRSPEQEKLQLESQLKSLLKYDSDQLMVYASGLDLPENAVRKLYPKYVETKRQLEAEKAKGLGNDHPSVREKIEQTEAIKRQLDESVANLQATLKAQLDLANNRLKSVEAMKNETREEAIKRGLDAQDYADAKKEFEKEQELLQQMKLKLMRAKLETPKLDLAKLMEEIPAAEDPYSTFSLNISDASFQIAQAALAKGEQPDPAGIKVEQFYNAVDYGDPAPSAGEPVAVSIEQSAHPVIPGRNLVRVALKTAAAGRSAAQPLRLTLLADQSGSMVREDRRAAMDMALAGLAGLLTEEDSVSVVGFSRTPRLLADSMPGNQAVKLAAVVNQSASEGGTNLEEAIKLGEQLAVRNQLAGAQNRVVLFTDGAANLGNADPARLAEKVKQLRQQGIAFDIAGIAADGLNDELLGELARNGNGRYYVVGKGADDNFAKQLAGAFRPAAENVKVQVRFNPERVGRYKLIGFEKDRLKTEDFRNDAVDAAELAAEEAGTAIYQVEPLPGGTGELGEVSVRFRDAASGQMVERTWTIPHDDKAPSIDRATPSMQLAVLSMLAAEKLKGGPLADAIDFQQLTDPRANVKRFYGNTGRVGEVLQMLDALK